MRLTRLFTPGSLAPNQSVTLTQAAANHVARVLRAKVGDAIAVFDGEGTGLLATISSIKGKSVVVTLGEQCSPILESALRITLVQGVSRGERMDWVVQKATELGVQAVVPALTARSVVKLDRKQAAAKCEHWRTIAINACEQCG